RGRSRNGGASCVAMVARGFLRDCDVRRGLPCTIAHTLSVAPTGTSRRGSARAGDALQRPPEDVEPVVKVLLGDRARRAEADDLALRPAVDQHDAVGPGRGHHAPGPAAPPRP